MYLPEDQVVAVEPTRQPSGVVREKIRVRMIIGHTCRIDRPDGLSTDVTGVFLVAHYRHFLLHHG